MPSSLLLPALLAAAALCAPHAAAEASQQDMDALFAWFRQRGGRLGPIAARRSPLGGWGLFATQPLAAGQLVVSVPPTAMMYGDIMEGSALAAALRGTAAAASPTNLIAAWLVAEARAGAGSEYAPWIASLPQPHELSSPLWWTAAELAQLQGSRLRSFVGHRRAVIARSHALLAPLLAERMPDLFDGAPLQLEELQWALSILWSRAFRVQPPPDFRPQSNGFIPIGDVMNSHLTQSSVSFAPSLPPEGNGSLDFVAARDIEAGEELLNLYGKSSCFENLLEYGYCNPVDNVHDRAIVNVTLPRGDRHWKRKRQLLQTLQLWDWMQAMPIESTGQLTETMLAVGRVVALKGRDLSTLRQPKAVAHMLHRKNELAAVNILAAATQRTLESYGTTVEEDDALLQAQAADAALNLRSALILRMAEKRILLRLAASLDAYRASL